MGDEPNDNGQGGSSKPDDANSKTFSQEDVDRVVADRLKRERAKFSDYDDLKAKADKLAQLEDKDKNEVEKLKEQLTASEKRAEKAESNALRSEIASAKGLTAAQAKRLAGSTKEELESDADDLLEAFGSKQSSDGDDSGKSDEDSKNKSDDRGRRPKEKLRDGASNQEEPEKTPDELADAVLKKSRGY